MKIRYTEPKRGSHRIVRRFFLGRKRSLSMPLNKLIQEAVTDLTEILNTMTTRQHADSLDAVPCITQKHMPQDVNTLLEILDDDPTIIWRAYKQEDTDSGIWDYIYTEINDALYKCWSDWFNKNRFDPEQKEKRSKIDATGR